MATTKRRPLEDLYPPDHPRQPHRRGVIDDTLDVYPPYHLFKGTPTPEDIEAAKRLAAERGYPLPPTLSPPPRRANRARPAGTARPKRAAEGRGKARKEEGDS